MTHKTWTLLDTRRGIYLDSLHVTPDYIGGSAEGYLIVKRRLAGGVSDGVDIVEIDNGAFRMQVLPTRGMGLWRAGCGDVELRWNSPARGPVHPSWVPLFDPSGVGWLEGFDEFLVRCGLESNGAPDFDENGKLLYPLHGRIANLPARKVELTVNGETGEITLSGTVEESRLFFKRMELNVSYTTYVNSPGVTIRDTVTNLSAEPAPFELLYHINLGPPLVAPGATMQLPFQAMAPRDEASAEQMNNWETMAPENPGSTEAAFYFDPAADRDGNTLAVLANAKEDRGLSLAYNRNQFPCFTFWKSHQADGDGYVAGLEPGINFPNPRSVEEKNGRIVTLPPKTSQSFEMTLEVQRSREEVQRAAEIVRGLQEEGEKQVSPQPKAGWS
jgi:galactose mutarotase-like enzyme